MADLSGIAAALKASLSPDAAIREPAQAALQAGCATPGALMSLLNLCVVAGVEQDVAMASAVLFKNEVKKRWAEGLTGVSDGEKQAIRQHIIGVICSCASHLQPVFREAMHRICCEDCHGAWPSAVEECGARYAAASFTNPETFIAPLHCLLLLAKAFQYKPEDQRARVEPLCAAISPTLLLTLQQSLQQPASPAIAEIQLIINKIFWSLTMFSLPNYFKSVDTLGVWLQAILAISTCEAPPSVAAMAPEDAWLRCCFASHHSYTPCAFFKCLSLDEPRLISPTLVQYITHLCPCPLPPLFFSSWWRLRKRASATLDRLMRLYLMPSRVKEGPHRALAEQLQATFTQVLFVYT